MTSMHGICDLGLPQSKNSGYANELEITWKTFLKTFFFFGEHLRLCPWSLALASSIPVLGLERVCPRKDCPWPRIFLCPWPQALCPRLHLWYLVTSSNQTAVTSKASRAYVGTEGYSDDTSAPNYCTSDIHTKLSHWGINCTFGKVSCFDFVFSRFVAVVTFWIS